MRTAGTSRTVRTALAGAGALALAALPLTAADASTASVARPAGSCGYTYTLLQDDSTAISVQVAPQCVGEASASPSLWEYVPISNGAQNITYSRTITANNTVILTYQCPGSAPNQYQLVYYDGASVVVDYISDRCGAFTEP